MLQDAKIDFEIRTTVIRELHPLQVLRDMATELSDKNLCDIVWILQSFRRKKPLLADVLGLQRSMNAYSDKEMQMIKDMLRTIIPSLQLR